MSIYLGDFSQGQFVPFHWNTFDAFGASVTRATNGALTVVRLSDNEQITIGVTDTEDDVGTGVHKCVIDTTDPVDYPAGEDYSVVLQAAVIDGQAINAALAHFSIENRSGLLASQYTAPDNASVATILGQTGTTGVVVAAASKTGYALSATGLDQISASIPDGVGTTFPQRLMRLFGRILGKNVRTSTQIVSYREDGTTPGTEQDFDVTAGTQTVEKAQNA